MAQDVLLDVVPVAVVRLPFPSCPGCPSPVSGHLGRLQRRRGVLGEAPVVVADQEEVLVVALPGLPRAALAVLVARVGRDSVVSALVLQICICQVLVSALPIL